GDMSRRGNLLPEMRRRAIAERLRTEGGGSVSEFEKAFEVSSMTIRRDLLQLERLGLAKRTHGGAVAPHLAGHEDSFTQRLGIDVDAKRRLAVKAAALVAPGETVFIDSSSSAYYVAREILENGQPATIITNSVPVLELSSLTDDRVEIIGVGGKLRRLTLS